MGADVNWTDKTNSTNGDTPLLAAVRNGHEEICSLLLAHGADTSSLTRDGENVFHLAARRGDETLISLFNDAKCSPNLRNGNNETPIDIAGLKGYRALSKRLEESVYGTIMGMAGLLILLYETYF